MTALLSAKAGVREFAATQVNQAWRKLIALKYDQLKERLVWETENRDALAGAAQALHELLQDSEPVNAARPTGAGSFTATVHNP